MLAIQEAKDLDQVKKCIALWCREYPGKVAPDFLIQALLEAEEAQRKERRKTFCDGFLQPEPTVAE